MNDTKMGLVEGLFIALLVAEKNEKHPERIQQEIVKVLQKAGTSIAYDAIDRIEVWTDISTKTH